MSPVPTFVRREKKPLDIKQHTKSMKGKIMCRSKLEGGRRCQADNNARMNKLELLIIKHDEELEAIMANQREQEAYILQTIKEKESFLASTADYSEEELSRYSEKISQAEFHLSNLKQRLINVTQIIKDTKAQMENAVHHSYTLQRGIDMLRSEGREKEARFYQQVKELQISMGQLHRCFNDDTGNQKLERVRLKNEKVLRENLQRIDNSEKSSSQSRFVEGIINESNTRTQELIRSMRSRAVTAP